MKISPFFVSTLILSQSLLLSCHKEEEEKPLQIPVIEGATISEISQTTARYSATVISDGGASVTSRGICWSIYAMPTLDDSLTTCGEGTGLFSGNLISLTPNTTYYARAYAITETDTAYGSIISFKTLVLPQPSYSLVKVIDGKEIRNLWRTADGGFIGVAFNKDFNVIKFDSVFNIQWDKSYGGSQGDYAECVISSNDGGYVVIGETLSSDGDVEQYHGDADIWICKLDDQGNLIWNRCYGGTGTEGVGRENAILQTQDGGFVFSGYTSSQDQDVSLNHGDFDIWVVRISATGTVESEKTYGGTGSDFGRNMLTSVTGNVLLTKVNSTNGDFNTSGCWVIQLDNNGNIVWKSLLEGINTGFLKTTADGGYVAVNTSFKAFELAKLNAEGVIVYTGTVDLQNISAKQPDAVKIEQVADGGFFVAGTLGNGNNADALLFRLSPDFTLLYNKIYNGNDFDMSFTFMPIADQKYLWQFTTSSSDIPEVSHNSVQASVLTKVDETSR